MSEVQAAPRRRINLGFDRFSGLYVWAALIVLFALWIPDLFLQVSTLKQVLSFQAIATIVALGLIIPVAAGAFDLTIGGVVSVSVCFTAWALVNHHGVVVAVVGSILLGIAVGLLNSLVVVKFKVDSFIGTLGMSSILIAVAAMISSQSIRLRSWRTLPGQSYACSTVSASVESSRGAMPEFSAERTRKCRASTGISSLRSRNAGIRSGTTARR